jgi:signal transduction histidine kinase
VKKKEHNSINDLDSAKKSRFQKQEITEPGTPFLGNADKKGTSESQLLLRLSKMEELNVHLESLFEDGKKKLSEVVASNAKFLSIVAHDLRNPFTTTVSILDLLKDNLDDLDKPEVQRLIDMAAVSTVRTLNLLDNLLAWSLLQNKQKSFNPEKINLRELVINEFESFNLAATQKQITMNQTIAPGLHVTADIQMVKTIFRNLIGNAIKYSNTGGVIFISATEKKKFIEIEVRDNGIGMSEKTKEKLFKIDEFHSMTGTNNEQGSGLGLLFCKEFIEAHGGRIGLESEPGTGSIFRFTLPHYI